jgi:1,4-dihydroxy-2-naphthoate octaprenyltransferase
MSRGVGEATIFLVFGPILTAGTFYALSGSLAWPAFLLGVPPGFLIAAVIWINQFPDFGADSMTGKRNLVVRLGTKRSRWVYGALMLLPFAVVVYMASRPHFSPFVLLGLLCLPLAIKAVYQAWIHFDSHTQIVPAQALTIQTHLALGLLISLGLVLSHVLQ